MTRYTLIAAHDMAYGIGRGNDLPWRIPEDLRFFKAQTQGKTILMGSNTADSLPKALPNRRNIVLSRHRSDFHEGMEVIRSLDDLQHLGESDIMVIGGAQIYSLLLPVAERLIITRVLATYPDVDVFFPRYNESEWQEEWLENVEAKDTQPALQFVSLVRKKER